MKKGYVYLVSNPARTTFYVGVTDNLVRRIQEHREGSGSAFTKKYRLHDLLYYEEHPTVRGAIQREKLLKNWHRKWKVDLIKTVNPKMRDLTEDIKR
jgi:putative endonuclease